MKPFKIIYCDGNIGDAKGYNIISALNLVEGVDFIKEVVEVHDGKL